MQRERRPVHPHGHLTQRHILSRTAYKVNVEKALFYFTPLHSSSFFPLLILDCGGSSILLPVSRSLACSPVYRTVVLAPFLTLVLCIDCPCLDLDVDYAVLLDHDVLRFLLRFPRPDCDLGASMFLLWDLSRSLLLPAAVSQASLRVCLETASRASSAASSAGITAHLAGHCQA
ncbi:hypothetical protein DFH06DRAFT_503974 [Mycena polygramma]|nr:hypothetical protein DFH06DRAFT_503974 [Mycena polygramma]